MQSILMTTPHLRSRMSSMAEDRAAIKNLGSMMETLLLLVQQEYAIGSSMKFDSVDGKDPAILRESPRSARAY